MTIKCCERAAFGSYLFRKRPSQIRRLMRNRADGWAFVTMYLYTYRITENRKGLNVRAVIGKGSPQFKRQVMC